MDFWHSEPDLVAVGNLVWNDANNNGVQDAGEAGIAGVTVELFAAGDDPLTATPVGTVTTDANGVYYFDNLIPGDYFVFIPASNFGAGQPLEGQQSCSPDGTDATTDTDDNGANTPVGGGIQSNTFTLASGAEPTAEANQGATYMGTLPDANVNSTIDFSFGPIPAEKVAVGNLVWNDANNNGTQDAGEVGIAGVTVELYAAGATPGTDAPLFTQITDANGILLV